MTASQDADKPHLDRIAIALERLADHFAPAPAGPADLNAGAAFVWRPAAGGPNSGLALAVNRERAPLDLLLGVERQRDILMTNTARFAKGAPANNALLWGARGTGKSALIKAVHATLAAKHKRLKLVEAAREDLPRLGELLAALEGSDARVIVFIDDLGFEQDEPSARALKPVLEGGLAGRPENVIVYATSNRRHLMARDPNENLPGDLMWADTAEERLSLADRFGLWLGFHAMDQDLYLAVVHSYAKRFGLDSKDVEERALAWSNMRGARSGRTAWQFILALAAALDKPIKF